MTAQILAWLKEDPYYDALKGQPGALAARHEAAKTETAYQSHFVNKRTFIGLFGPARASALMRALATAAQTQAGQAAGLDEIHSCLDTTGNERGDRGGLDIGCAIGQQQADALASVLGLTADELATIKALGLRAVSKFEAAYGRPMTGDDAAQAMILGGEVAPYVVAD